MVNYKERGTAAELESADVRQCREGFTDAEASGNPSRPKGTGSTAAELIMKGTRICIRTIKSGLANQARRKFLFIPGWQTGTE